MDSRVFTYQTRLEVDNTQENVLQETSSLFGHIERSLFADFSRGSNILKLKSDYLKKYGITARQFNSIRVKLEGKIRSVEALQKERLEEVKAKLETLTKRIHHLSKLKHKTHKQASSLHQKKRKLSRLTQNQEELASSINQGKVSLCFGSKKLFQKQFYLEENGYTTHENWKEDWEASRANQFYVLGSKDETMGNQSCVMTMQADGSLNLRLRVPDALIEQHGKHIEFRNLRFAYGHAEIQEALNDNLRRHNLSKKLEKQKHGDLYKSHGQAINFLFLKDEKGWRVFVTIQRTLQPKSLPYHGAIGLDINANHLAITEIDHTGNYKNSFNIPLNLYGKSKNQAKALIGDAIKQLVDYAQEKQKPLIIEQLDFAKKKRDLNQESPKYARMLSSFSYASIIEMLKSRAYRANVSVFQVNPAFTSVIGRVKFARIYNQLSVHQAAAMVIARRFFGFSERLPHSLDHIPDNKGGHVTLQGLVKNPVGHVWRTWAKVKKILQGVLAAPYQKHPLGAGPPELTRWDESLSF